MDRRQGMRRLEWVSRLIVVGAAVSLFGWIFEVCGRAVVYGVLEDRGLLSLPLCTIYGVSVVSIYVLVGTPERLSGFVGERLQGTAFLGKAVKNKKWRPYAFYFVFVTLVSTAVELVTGLVMLPFGIKLWNYGERAFNIWGIICPSYSILWGVLITFFMRFLWKPLYCAVGRIRVGILLPLSFTISVAVVIDLAVNLIIVMFG